MVLQRKKKSQAAPAGIIAAATGAAGALAAYALRRRRRGREAEPPASNATNKTNAVMPDTSSDPLVDEQTNAAAAQAGAIGGSPNDMATGGAGFPEDPGMRVVEEGSGDSEESFETGTEEIGR